MLRRTLTTGMASAAILALTLAGTAQAQELPPDSQPPDGTPPQTEPPPEAEPEAPPEAPPEVPPEAELFGDPHPLVVLHAINQIQSQLGLMGVNEASNPQIREFAGDLAESHNSFDRSMLETANDLDIDVAGSGEVRIAMEERLQNLDPQLHMLMEAPPQAFDAAFLELVVRSQQDAIDAVQALREEAEDQQVRTLINQALNGYEGHLERAQQLQSEIGGEGEQGQQPQQPENPTE